MEPKIEIKNFDLVGMEIKINLSYDDNTKLITLQYKFINEIKKVANTNKNINFISYWYYKQNNSNKELYDCYYLACVEKKNIMSMPDNFVNIILPQSLFAIFNEERRGIIGGPEGYAYKTWLPNSGYKINHKIMGDLEIYKDINKIGPNDACEILIPISIN